MTRLARSGIALALLLALLAGGATWVARAEGDAAAPVWIPISGMPVSITSTEVTVAQFGACIDAGSCALEHASACNIALEGRADHPMNCVDYFAAEQYCAFAAGRICSEDEWLAACRGAADRPFPYGDSYDAAACNASPSGSPGGNGAPSTARAGSYAGCGGGLAGLFDMAGNVWEWVDACQDDYCKFRGGAYLTNQPVERFAGCGLPCSGNRKAARLVTVGIRCCRDNALP